MIREELIGRKFKVNINNDIYTILQSSQDNNNYYCILNEITDESNHSWAINEVHNYIDNGNWILQPILIDYTIPGTSLPRLTGSLRFRCAGWNTNTNYSTVNIGLISNLISYGTVIINDIEHIQIEKNDYPNINYTFAIPKDELLTAIEVYNNINIPNNISNIIETISPFPEKWVIKLTEENIEIVGNYYNQKVNSAGYPLFQSTNNYLKSHNVRGQYINSLNPHGSFRCSRIPPNYIEITTEQFINNVLNNQIVENNMSEILKQSFKLSHKDIKKDDCIFEIYNNTNGRYISLMSDSHNGCYIDINKQEYCLEGYLNHFANLIEFRYATEEEKHWILECKKLNKYISFEESMKTFKNFNKEEEIIVYDPLKGYSLSQFSKALESIKWMEKDDAKDIFIEIKKYLETIKIEQKELII